MRAKLGTPLIPIERAVVMQHIGGFSMKAGATALGLTYESYAQHLAQARRRLGTVGLSGRVKLERAWLAYIGGAL